MSKTESLLQMVHEGFGTLADKVVFIGGSVLNLYATDPCAPLVRPTEDVDCLIDAASKLEMQHWENTLADRGVIRLSQYGPDESHWQYNGVHVHVLTVFPELSGFENRWFEEGFFHARSQAVNERFRLRLLTPVYFLASKLEALIHRGWEDLLLSEDLEDIVYLIRYRPELKEEVQNGFYEVRTYIQERMDALLMHSDFDEALFYMVGHEGGAKLLRTLPSSMKQMSAPADLSMSL